MEKEVFIQFIKITGFDRAVLITLIARAWSILGGVGSIYFLSRFLTPELQGYYYTFNSLIALQLFAELGLTYAIVQFTSHEMAELSWAPEGVVAGSSKAKRRLQSILYFTASWFAVGVLVMIAVLMPLGIYFFNATAAPLDAPRYSTTLPWLLLVCTTGVNLIVAAFVAILEGCGKIDEVATIRLYQSIFSIITVWIVLSFGWELYSLAISGLMTGMIGAGILLGKHRTFFIDLLQYKETLPGVSWRREIWPFQWRIALSWSSGFLIFNLFNPLLFLSHGPIVAGQMGMSLQIINAMNNAAMAWITTKIPTYGSLVATKQIAKLNKVFFRSLIQSFIFLLMLVTVVLITIFYLTMMESRYSNRVLPAPLLIILGIVCLANHAVFAEAAYLRAYKEEPFMLISVLNGCTTAILAVLLIPTYGASGAVYSYAVGAMLIGLGGGTVIFRQKLKNTNLRK